MMLWTPHKAIFRTQKISHKNGAMEIWDIWAKMGPFWAPGGPEGTQYQVKVSGDHESNPGRPIGGSWDQIWSPGALRGPQKGHFGQIRDLLGPPGAQKGPDTRSKCVVSMSLTQTGQSGAVGTKSGPPGPSEDLRGPRKDL